MSSEDQWGYYRGVLLPAIAEALGVPTDKRRGVCDKLHNLFKELFEVKSINKADESDMQWFLGYIHILFAREFGIILPEPNEPSVFVLNRMGMRPFLNYQLSKELGERITTIVSE